MYNYLFKHIKKILPKISETEIIALKYNTMYNDIISVGEYTIKENLK